MLKGYRKLNKYLTDWCNQNGFDVKCRLDTDFGYDSDKHIIYYSIIVPQKHDELFIKICKKYLPSIINCDNFILSFFHELGHYATNEDYSDEEWDAYCNFLDSLPSELSLRDYKRYYKYPIELNATIWGCTYIEDHLTLVEQLSKNIGKLVKEFYKANNIEID